jgi:hypothetical protein
VLPDEPTRNEARFLREQNIVRIAAPLSEFSDALAHSRIASKELAVSSW